MWQSIYNVIKQGIGKRIILPYVKKTAMQMGHVLWLLMCVRALPLRFPKVLTRFSSTCTQYYVCSVRICHHSSGCLRPCSNNLVSRSPRTVNTYDAETMQFTFIFNAIKPKVYRWFYIDASENHLFRFVAHVRVSTATDETSNVSREWDVALYLPLWRNTSRSPLCTAFVRLATCQKDLITFICKWATCSCWRDWPRLTV